MSLYFSDFNHLFELLDQVLLLIAVVPVIYWNYAKNAHCEFYEQFSCRKRMFPIQSFGVEYKVCLRHAGGSNMTKPIFSNSRKRHYQSQS